MNSYKDNQYYSERISASRHNTLEEAKEWCNKVFQNELMRCFELEDSITIADVIGKNFEPHEFSNYWKKK